MKRRSFVLWAIALFLSACAFLKSTARDVATVVVDDLCKEILGATDAAAPDTVTLLCKTAAGDAVQIVLPREAWMRARSHNISVSGSAASLSPDANMTAPSEAGAKVLDGQVGKD